MAYFRSFLFLILSVPSLFAADRTAFINNLSKCQINKVYEKVSGFPQISYPDVILQGKVAQFKVTFPAAINDPMGVKAHVRYDVICQRSDAGEFIFYSMNGFNETIVVCLYSSKTKFSSARACEYLIEPKDAAPKTIVIEDL